MKNRAKQTNVRRVPRDGSRAAKWWSWTKNNLGIVALAAGALLAIIWQVLHVLGYIHSHR